MRARAVSGSSYVQRKGPRSGAPVARYLLLACLGGGTGCAAHGTATASFSASGGASGSVSGEAKASGTATAKLSERVTLVGDRLEYEGEINFKYDSSILQGSDTVSTLGQVRDIMKVHPEVKIHVEGHADSRGDDEYNRRLSDARAKSIMRWIVDNGIAADRLTAKGYGADKAKEPERCRDKTGPDASFKGDTECLEAWQKNRRTVLRVISGLQALRVGDTPSAPPRADAPPRKERDDGPSCPVRLGGRLSVLGPAVHGSLAFAAETACFLELSLGLGYKAASAYPSFLFGSEASTYQDQSAFALLGRARFWLLREHSPLLDVGVAASRYSGGSIFPHASLGGGYGYRSASPFRIALIVGVLLPAPAMGSPSGFGEVSVGLLW